MKLILQNRLKEILWHGDDALLELVLAINTIAWGLWILFPPDILHARVFSYMLSAMPEVAWGILFTIVGTIKLMALIMNKRGYRMIVTALASGFWTWIAYLLFKGSPYALIPSSVIIWAAVNALLFMRHRFKKEQIRQQGVIQAEDYINEANGQN